MSTRPAPPCPGGWRCSGWAVPGTELGWRPGSQGMLLFGQQDPRGPSIAQVIMSIKHQTWPAALLRHCLPPRVLY